MSFTVLYYNTKIRVIQLAQRTNLSVIFIGYTRILVREAINQMLILLNKYDIIK